MFLLLGTSSKSGSKLKPKIHKSELKFAHVYRKTKSAYSTYSARGFCRQKNFCSKGNNRNWWRIIF